LEPEPTEGEVRAALDLAKRFVQRIDRFLVETKN